MPSDESFPDSGPTQSHSAHMSTEAHAKHSTPERLDVHISLEGIPSSITDAIANLGKPTEAKSKFRTFLKDYLPALTPIATAVISVAISIYTYRANDHRSTEALDKTVSEFGSTNLDERAREISAIRLAAYGDKALPAVKMVLGANDRDLRTGGVL